MNDVSELRMIEDELQAAQRLPLSVDQMQRLARRAEQERSQAIAAMLAAAGRAIVGYLRALRESAVRHGGARLRHN
jgi:hypothetical protein